MYLTYTRRRRSGWKKVVIVVISILLLAVIDIFALGGSFLFFLAAAGIIAGEIGMLYGDQAWRDMAPFAIFLIIAAFVFWAFLGTF